MIVTQQPVNSHQMELDGGAGEDASTTELLAAHVRLPSRSMLVKEQEHVWLMEPGVVGLPVPRQTHAAPSPKQLWLPCATGDGGACRRNTSASTADCQHRGCSRPQLLPCGCRARSQRSNAPGSLPGAWETLSLPRRSPAPNRSAETP